MGPGEDHENDQGMEHPSSEDRAGAVQSGEEKTWGTPRSTFKVAL